MVKKKLLLLALLCVAIVILLYVCHMLAPLLDDVWKILLVGAIVGAIPGFWVGQKWRDVEMSVEEEARKAKDKL